MTTKTLKLKIVARAGWIDRPGEMLVWVTRKTAILIYERRWPGVWPPNVGDTMTVQVEDETPGEE